MGLRQRLAHRDFRVELAGVGLPVVDLGRVLDGLADGDERMEQHHVRTPLAFRAQQHREPLDHHDESALVGARRRVGMGFRR